MRDTDEFHVKIYWHDIFLFVIGMLFIVGLGFYIFGKASDEFILSCNEKFGTGNWIIENEKVNSVGHIYYECVNKTTRQKNET